MRKEYPLRNRDIPFKIIDQKAYILRGNCLYELNKASTRIWQLIDGTRSTKEIIACIAREYKIDSKIASADTLHFIEKLLKGEMLTLRDKPLC